MHTTWILVADSGRARLFEPAPEDGRLVEIECFTNPEGRAGARHSGTHRAPTVNESVGLARHAIEPHTTPREKNTSRFAHALGEALERGHARRRFERLVLVAPPRFLGALHEHLGKPVLDSVAGEVRRDLTALSLAELSERLPRRLLRRQTAAGSGAPEGMP